MPRLLLQRTIAPAYACEWVAQVLKQLVKGFALWLCSLLPPLRCLYRPTLPGGQPLPGGHQGLHSAPAPLYGLQEGTAYLIADRLSSDTELPSTAPSASNLGDQAHQSFSYLYTAKAIWQPAASVCSVYTITLAIFPGFLAEDISSQQLGSWYPVLLITAFNIADCHWQNTACTSTVCNAKQELDTEPVLGQNIVLASILFGGQPGLWPKRHEYSHTGSWADKWLLDSCLHDDCSCGPPGKDLMASM